MRPVILLTGKNGQIGTELLRFLPQLGEVVALDRHQLDLSKPHDISRTIREIRPQIIVNAAAYTAVDQAETDEAMARAVNGKAPGLLAKEGKKIGAFLVHYSTDYVFDGLKKSPYEETDLPNPINSYGKTKLEGEVAIRRAKVPHLIFRTAWVYATRGRNFLLAILRRGTEHEELRIVCDQIGAPTWASEIAVATTKILASVYGQSFDARAFRTVSGTYHISAAGETTWFDFAKAILDEAAHSSQDASWLAAATRGLPLIARRVIPITSAEYGSAAPRPAYSVLSNSLLTKTFGIALCDWRTQLQNSFVSVRLKNPLANFEIVSDDDYSDHQASTKPI
jgi:dTDP-4-dehydrorhamnose reductase